MRPRSLRLVALLACALLACNAAWAQEPDEDDENKDAQENAPPAEPQLLEMATEAVPEDAASGSFDDATGSVEGIRGAAPDLVIQGWQLSGDMRVGLVRADTDFRDGTTDTTTSGRGRFRIGGVTNLTEWLVFDARLATSCTTDECSPGLDLDDSLDNRSSIDDGTITLDEFYVHFFRRAKFDVAIGRLQTKFVARSGVFAKSLDRNNSNGFNVNWTDGIHGTYHFREQSIFHFIAEHNSEDGASSIRREPLDFTSSSTRTSYFVAWESQERFGPFTQRGLDVTYLPNALIKDGRISNIREDYVAFVGRFAMSKAIGTKGRRWNVAGEAGYAPETPTRQSINLPGEGDAGGTAWNIAASLMDFWPNHSFGINYGRADAGWLISPQYRDNEELVEARYLWRRSKNVVVDARIRWRDQLESKALETQQVDEVEFFIRITLGFAR